MENFKICLKEAYKKFKRTDDLTVKEAISNAELIVKITERVWQAMHQIPD